MAAVQDIDHGYKEIIRRLQKLDKKEIKAGILKNAGKGKNGVSIAEYATYNEFGTKRIPSRPFIRKSFDQHSSEWGDIAENGVGDVIDRKISPEKCCKLVGRQMKFDIKGIIGKKSEFAPNKPATVRRKGHSKPLIDTSAMRSAVDFEVK